MSVALQTARPAPLEPTRATAPAFDFAALTNHVESFEYRRQPFLCATSVPPTRTGDFDELLFLGILGYEQGLFEDAAPLLSSAGREQHVCADLALFYLGLTLARLGQPDAAFAAFTQAFPAHRLGPALLESACIAVAHDDETTAMTLFRLLLKVIGYTTVINVLLDMRELRVYTRVLAEVMPRIARLLEPCNLLGPASERLTQRNDRVIGSLLDAAWDDLTQGRTPPPELAGRWSATSAPVRPLRVLMIFSRHINCSERYIQHDVLHHFKASADERGHVVEVFHADRLLYPEGAVPPGRVIDGSVYTPSEENLPHELARLRDAIEAFDPELVLLEANFVPSPKTISPAFFQSLSSRRRFCLAAVVPDLTDGTPDFAAAWAPAVDHVLAFNEQGELARAHRDAGRLMYFPSVPFVLNPHRHSERTLDFVFVGSGERGRGAVLAEIARHVPNHRITLTDRRTDTVLVRTDNFNQLMASGKTTFNTGLMQSHRPGIQTGRVMETMMARTALIEEFPAAVTRAFVPFVHFLPVDRADQAVAYTQFLAAHPQHRERIVDAALDFVGEFYSPAHFWWQLESAV